MDPLATPENFEERAYLAANPDVVESIAEGKFKSGREHFEIFGHQESRRLKAWLLKEFQKVKKQKLKRIEPLLQRQAPRVYEENWIDFLTPELRDKFAIIDTEAISSNEYDEHARSLIAKYADGLILDCGAGYRPLYYSNIVNFEIAAYPSTDVRGVGEVLPFRDNCFDAVLSLAVLEHVKDPFACARELVRVLKPGGELMCCVPLLQPVHGYPNHYYNMTAQGLTNLFAGALEIDRHEVIPSTLPIWSLTWMIRSWADGLSGDAKQEFLDLKMSDLLNSGQDYLGRAFVRELSSDKNFELASATVLFGHKLK